MNDRQLGDVGGGGLNSWVFHKIISLENLLLAWREFRRGKRQKKDVAQFEFNLEDNLFSLHQSLKQKLYEHGKYTSFYVRDPKLRLISKATVRDRVLHQEFFRIFYRIFDPSFIHDSYSCRKKKGTHKGVLRLGQFTKKVTGNHCQTAYALKCDVRKFFDSVDQATLFRIIERKVKDPDTLWLIGKIIGSFSAQPGRGLPLGNVTSQLFANIYLNELDQFTKHKLKQKYYLRYCDDFIVLSRIQNDLILLLPQISNFLLEHLGLILHPGKVIFRKASRGIDFLGYVILPHYLILRTKTKRRLLRKIKRRQVDDRNWSSYLGILGHCRGHKIFERMIA